MKRQAFLIVFYFLFLSQTFIDAEDGHLKVHFFPVGEGDATIIECDDMSGNVSLTLVNAGSVSKQQDEIQMEYFKFLASKLSQPNYQVKNIILTSADPKYYNFIEPLILLKRTDLMKIDFYLGGQRISYVILDEIFKVYENVYEFTRANEIGGKVGSCGHYNKNKTFYECVKRDIWGPVENSNEIINICDGYQVSVMAANYGFSYENNEEEDERTDIQRKDKNSLLLKVTPSGQSSPSILLGDFENDGFNTDTSDDYYTFIRDAHAYYTETATYPNLSAGLSKGLASTVIKLLENGAITDASVDSKLYSQFVRPTYAIVSSGINDAPGHPKCEVMQAVNTYLSTVADKNKPYQCHPVNSKSQEDINVVVGSNNLYQTSTLDLGDYVHGRVQHNLISLEMTPNQVRKLTSQVVFHVNRY